MDVETRRNVCQFKNLHATNKVCSFWLAGKCNRNPCRFMHRDSPAPASGNSHRIPSQDSSSRKMTWTKPSHDSLPKKVTLTKPSHDSSPEKMTWTKPSHYSSLKKMTVTKPKFSTGTNRDKRVQAQQVNKNPKEDEEEADTMIGEKLQPKQCKHWTTGSCVFDSKCKDLHSWFYGSGFSVLTHLTGHKKAITGIALPSGSDKLFSASEDNCIHIWDCNSGQCISSLSVDGDVNCMCTEGPLMYVGLRDSVKVWNTQTQTELSLCGFAGRVHCIVEKNGVLFLGMENGTILVWKWNRETNNPEQAAVLMGHTNVVCSLVVGGTKLYSGSRDCSIRVWDLETLQCAETLTGHEGYVTSLICWECYLISASIDNTMKIWDADESGILKIVSEFKLDCGVLAVQGIHDSESKPILLCSCSDCTVRLYDLPSLKERARIFTKKEAWVIELGPGGFTFIGDGTGDITVCKFQ